MGCFLRVESGYNPTVRVCRSFTFSEQSSQHVATLDVTHAQVSLFSPNGTVQAIPMSPEYKPALQETCFGLDFLWGSGNFNYLLNTSKLQSGESYALSVESVQYENIRAETEIPGPFQITEISNTDPELLSTIWEPIINPQPKWAREFAPPLNSFYAGLDYFTYKPLYFRVRWTESTGAASYLVDLTLLEFNINHLMNQQGELLYQSDSLGFVSVPYKEKPIYFLTSENEYRHGIITHELELKIPLKTFLQMIGFHEKDVLRYEFYDPHGSGIYIVRPNYMKRIIQFHFCS